MPVLDQVSLTAQIKEMQRSDATAKEQWWMYCDAEGAGVRDPAKHDASFLATFINSYDSGMRFEPANDLGELFKEGQRKSSSWKQAWASYCTLYGDGKSDPTKKDQAFLVGFFDYMGQRGAMALSSMGAMASIGSMVGMPGMAGMTGMGSMGGMAGMARSTISMGTLGAPAAKRMRTEVFPISSGDPEKDALVSRVKAYQRSGDEQKQTWWTYCDTMLGGKRDPAKHDVATLQEFVDTHVDS